MKEIYLVNVSGESETSFEGYYDEKEIEIIEKFLDDMTKSDIPVYDCLCIEFQKMSDINDVDEYFDGSFSQSYGYGFYAFVNKIGQLVIGEERGREGGHLYRGKYEGKDTSLMNKIKKESITLYNSIVKYFE